MKIAEILNGTRRNAPSRIALLICVLLFLGTFVPPAPPPPSGAPAEAFLYAEPVPLEEDAPGRRRIGDLVYLGGWHLRSSDRRFGGISAMQIEEDQVTAISDAGTVLQFPLPTRAGPGRIRVTPLPRAHGNDKSSLDTESLQIDGAQAWIGFERLNAILRYRREGWSRESMARPVPMRRWRANNGPEAMVRFPDGRFLVFAEGRRDDPFSPAILFEGDPALAGTSYRMMRYRRPEGFRPTDAALLPDGRLLVLNRRLGWLEGISAKLVMVEAAALRSGTTLAGREVATLRSPMTVDNMEALAVTREGGRTIVRIASDDNFMALQRTLLLEFALVETARD